MPGTSDSRGVDQCFHRSITKGVLSRSTRCGWTTLGGRLKIKIRQAAKRTFWGLAVVVALSALYLSVFFLPYPLFPHHAELAGFSVYSDREIPSDFKLVAEDARHRVEAMEPYRGAATPRIFVCRSRRLFVFFVKLAGMHYAGQGLGISAAGSVFLSAPGIEAVGRRNGGQPVHSRLQGSWAAAIAHEVAHGLVFAELGFKRARRIPVWKSEGYADYSANLAAAASDTDYDFRSRIRYLLDDDSWRLSVKHFDRRHFRWHVLVEFLCSVKGLTFEDLIDESVSEDRAWDQTMAWYSTGGS